MGHISITKREFLNRAKEGNLIPVFRRLLGDMATPISLFMRMGGPSAENSFMLESVVNGEDLGRNTFLGTDARAIIRGTRGRFRLSRPGQPDQEFEGEPLAFLEEQFRGLKPVRDERLPGFYGGAVGFLAYDGIRYYEDLPDNNPDPVDQEDAYFILTDELVIVDHVERNLRLVHNVRLDEHASAEAAYAAAMERLDALEERINTVVPEPKPITVDKKSLDISSNMSAEEFREKVVKAREYIKAGDIFQVVLSKRFSFNAGVPPFQVYRALRSVNPSPYMYYLNAGPYKIVGSSPEILVRIQDKQVVIRPIAGTRRRGRTPETDRALAEDLLSDQKEIAEHIMLVDLGRNDAGRVSKPGSVEVTEFKVIERYSHVMHIVSNCRGILRDDVSPFDALRAALPAGTVSGAPKIRAMEIIDELENVRRGIYAGGLGFFNFDGEYDSAIILRTMIFKDGTCHLQAGAGIVYDSDPEKECEEVANKVRGMLRAVRFARRGLR